MCPTPYGDSSATPLLFFMLWAARLLLQACNYTFDMYMTR